VKQLPHFSVLLLHGRRANAMMPWQPCLWHGHIDSVRKRYMTWTTPQITEIRCGMEVTSYESADIDGIDSID
jgi:coenzyme PQQ precursor peptide PqqA